MPAAQTVSALPGLRVHGAGGAEVSAHRGRRDRGGRIAEQAPCQVRAMSFGVSSPAFGTPTDERQKWATNPAESCSNPTRGRGRAGFLQEPENIFLF